MIFCIILMSLTDSGVSDSYDNCVDDCAVVDAISAVGTEQELENKHMGQFQAGQSTGITSFNWEDLENCTGHHDTVAVFLLFFSRDLIDDIMVETD